MSLITEYPVWFFIFCVALGLLYAGILYYKNKREEFSVSTVRWLAAFRFVTVVAISFLLLSPMMKNIFRTTEKPLIILAHDNSESVMIGEDSAYYRRDFPDAFAKIAKNLDGDYEIKSYGFSDRVAENEAFSYDGKQTDISAFFDEMITRYSNRNVGAIILASDGIYNKGLNPLYTSDQVKFPVYTVALGDTAMHKDAFISKVNFNRIAFLGNEFPIEVIIGANMCAGQKTTLTLSNGGIMVFSKNITFKSDQYFETIKLQLEAKSAGLQRYSVRLAPLEGEISTINNRQDIFIDILDAKQKILILAASPHPDISALRTAIESNYNYEVTQLEFRDFKGEIESYNLIVLHQIPGQTANADAIVAKATAGKIPILYILGSKENIPQFNALKTGVQIITDQSNFNEAQAVFNPDFTLFTVGEATQKSLEAFPPLLVPFGEYNTANSANPLFYQQIGPVVTSYPLVVFNQTLDNKTGVIAGEGIWKWRLHDYLKNNNHNAFNEIITKMIQFLSVKVDKSFFKVLGANNFLENESVNFDAEVYNQSYELINDPEVEMTITNSSGDTYPFVFGKTAKAYQLSAGILPVDNYTYEARVRDGDKIYSVKGAFTISPLNIEAVNTIADHNLLFQLAYKTSGKMVYPGQLDQIPDMLRQREDITTITYTQKKYSELINIPWILVLILALLSIEWFIRKRGGSY